jgi:hypothetical protein
MLSQLDPKLVDIAFIYAINLYYKIVVRVEY